MALSVTIKDNAFQVGDTVRVHYKIIERDVIAGKTKKEKKEEKKERIQVFEGIVISAGGTGVGKTFVVRRIGVDNVGIERIFPVNSPWIDKVDVKKKGKVRRAKLYYLRSKTKKEIAKLGAKMGKVTSVAAHVKVEPVVAPEVVSETTSSPAQA